jgi:capsular exopolysaccharide synthesis family protein
VSKFFKALEQAEKQRQDRPLDENRPTPVVVAELPREVPPRAQLEPVVEEVPAPPSRDLEEHLVSFLDPLSAAAEEYRTLRTVVEEACEEGRRVVAVSSPVRGDGKTLTTVNLAGALAQSATLRVLLVDADLRYPSIARLLRPGKGRTKGLVDAVRDRSLTLADLVQTTPSPRLSLLGAGTLPQAPYEVLQSSRVHELMDEARRAFDYVIVDTPPIVALSDYRLIEKWIDRFLLVVAAHRTPRGLIEEALRLVEPEKLIGFVFNMADRTRGSSPYGYYYHHPSEEGMRANGRFGVLRRLLGRSKR